MEGRHSLSMPSLVFPKRVVEVGVDVGNRGRVNLFRVLNSVC